MTTFNIPADIDAIVLSVPHNGRSSDDMTYLRDLVAAGMRAAPPVDAVVGEPVALSDEALSYLNPYFEGYGAQTWAEGFRACERSFLATPAVSRAEGLEPSVCTGCEGRPSLENSPCAVCRAGVASLVARMTRLKDAIEGECNGLAITDDVAREIIAYIDTGLPPYLRSAGEAQS